MGKTNGLAVASLILGIIGLCVIICAPIALILGIIARGQIKRSGGSGSGMALAGIILGIVAIVLYIIGMVLNFALGLALLGM